MAIPLVWSPVLMRPLHLFRPVTCSSDEAKVKDWNVVVTVFDRDGFRAARRTLARYGAIERTGFFNVLVMKVDDVRAFTREFTDMAVNEPGVLNDISRLVPAQATFDFETPEEFSEQARETVLGWADRLAGGSFYVRLHRRGLRGQIISPDEERALDFAIIERCQEMGNPAAVDFADPDHIIDIETVDNRAGLSLWSREELERMPFLHVD